MAKTMKAAVVREFGRPLTIEDGAKGNWPVKPAPPFVARHEGVGTVVEAGSDVKRIKEGDRVGVPWLYTAPRQ